MVQWVSPHFFKHVLRAGRGEPLRGDLTQPIFQNTREFDSHNILFLLLFASFSSYHGLCGTLGRTAYHNTGMVTCRAKGAIMRPSMVILDCSARFLPCVDRCDFGSAGSRSDPVLRLEVLDTATSHSNNR
jgi:hypothetical protein